MRRQTNYALIAASLALSATNDHQAVAFIPKLGISISPRFERFTLKSPRNKGASQTPKKELKAFSGNNNDGDSNFNNVNPFNSSPNNQFNSPSNNPFNNPFNNPPGNPFDNAQSSTNSPGGFQPNFGTNSSPPPGPSFSFSRFNQDENEADPAEKQRAMEAARDLQEKTAARLRQVEDERLAQGALRSQQDEFRREAEDFVQEQKTSIPRDQANADWEAQSASRIEEAAEAARRKAEEMRNMYPAKDSPFASPMNADSGMQQTPPFGSNAPVSSPFNSFGQAPAGGPGPGSDTPASPPFAPFSPSAPGAGSSPFAPGGPSGGAPSFGTSAQTSPWSTPASSSEPGSFEDEMRRREATKAQFHEQRGQQQGGSFYGNDANVGDFRAQQEAAIKAEEEARMQAQRLQTEVAKRQEEAANQERVQRMQSFTSAKTASTDDFDVKDPRQAAIRAAEEQARKEANENERMRRELEAQRKADQEAQNKRRQEMLRKAAEEDAKLEAEIEEKRKKAKEAREAAINAAKRKKADEEQRKRDAEEEKKRKAEDRVMETRLRAEGSRLKAEAERNRQEIKDYVQNRRSEADAWRMDEQEKRFSPRGKFPSDEDAKLRAEEARQWGQAQARQKYGGVPGAYEDEETVRVRNVYSKWADFYGKRFDEQRFETFRRNLVEIERHYNNAGGPVQLNEFADLTSQEYRLREQDPMRWEEEERRRAFEQQQRWEEEQMLMEEQGLWDRRQGFPADRAGGVGFPRQDPMRGDRYDPWRQSEENWSRSQGPYPTNSAIDVDILEQARRRGQYDAARKAETDEKMKSAAQRQEEEEKARLDELRKRGEAAKRQKEAEEAKLQEEEEAKKRSIEEAKRRGEEEAIRRANAEAKRLEEEAKALEAKKKALEDARIRGQYVKQKQPEKLQSDQQQPRASFSTSGQREERLQVTKESIFEGARMRAQQGGQGQTQQEPSSRNEGSPSDPWNVAMMRGKDAARKRAEAEAKLKKEEEEKNAQKQVFFDTVKERAQQESKRREEAANKERMEEEERKKRLEEEAKIRAAEDEAKRAEAQARIKQEQEKAREEQRKALEAARIKMEEETEGRKKEAVKRKEEQAALAQKQLQAREEARAKAAAEAKLKAEAEAKRRKEQIELAAQERERQQREKQQATAAAKRKTEDIERNKAAQLMRAQEERNRKTGMKQNIDTPSARVNPFGTWQPGQQQESAIASFSKPVDKVRPNQPVPSDSFGPAKPASSLTAKESSPEPKVDTAGASQFGSYMDSLGKSEGNGVSSSSRSPFGSYIDSIQKPDPRDEGASKKEPAFPSTPEFPKTASGAVPSASGPFGAPPTPAGPTPAKSTSTPAFPPGNTSFTPPTTSTPAPAKEENSQVAPKPFPTPFGQVPSGSQDSGQFGAPPTPAGPAPAKSTSTPAFPPGNASFGPPTTSNPAPAQQGNSQVSPKPFPTPFGQVPSGSQDSGQFGAPPTPAEPAQAKSTSTPAFPPGNTSFAPSTTSNPVPAQQGNSQVSPKPFPTPFGQVPGGTQESSNKSTTFETEPLKTQPSELTPSEPQRIDRDADPINTSLDDGQLERLKIEAITKRQVAEAALKRAQELKQAAADELASKNTGFQDGNQAETAEVGAMPQETSYMDKVAKSFVAGAAKLEELNKEIAEASEKMSTTFGSQSESIGEESKQESKGIFSRIFGGNESSTAPEEGNQGDKDDSNLPFFLSNMQAPSPASDLLGNLPGKPGGTSTSTAIPTIAAWGQTPEGSIYGFIRNSPYFEDGAYIITTPVQKGATGGSVVETASGSRYLLAKDQEDFAEVASKPM